MGQVSLKRPAVVAFFITLSVTLSVGPAAAACAWVLWIEHKSDYYFTDKPREHLQWWELRKAFTTIKECEEVKRRVYEVVAKQYSDPSRNKGIEKIDKAPFEGIFITLKKMGTRFSGHQNKYFRCLPDTLDPRK